MQTTTNYGLKKPEGTDVVDIQNFNDNADIIDENLKLLAAQSSEGMNILIPKSGSTANAILLDVTTFTSNKKYSFKATAASTGNVTINEKAFKKLDGTQIGNGGIKANKVYDFYYDGTANCVFILAKAVGTATVADVLAPKTFSNGDDIEITGTMPNNGAVSSTLTNNNQEYTIPTGFHNGLGKIKAIITNLAAAVIKAGTTAGGIVGTFTSDATALAADIISGKSAYVNGVKIVGIASIESLGGKKFFSGAQVGSDTTVSFTNSSGGTNTYAVLDVTGFDFVPSYAIVASYSAASGSFVSIGTIYVSDDDGIATLGSTKYKKSANSNIVVASGRLKIPVISSTSWSHHYYIFE